MQFAPGVKLRVLLVSGLLAVIFGAVKIPRPYRSRLRLF
jgi:hypothetical protein